MSDARAPIMNFAREAGETYKSIGNRYGVSGSRVNQIIEKWKRKNALEPTQNPQREMLSTRAFNVVANSCGLGADWSIEDLRAFGIDAIIHLPGAGKKVIEELSRLLDGQEASRNE